MKIALAQINTTIGDFENNSRLILDYLRLAGQRKADLVIFPELTLTGYPPKDLLDRPDFIRANVRAIQKLAKKITGPACLVGFVEPRKSLQGRPLANAAAWIADKKIHQVFHKRLLPTYDVFDEGRYFQAGNEEGVFSWQGRKLGVSICEDIWSNPKYWGRQMYDSDPIAGWIESGAEAILNLSASPFSLEKARDRKSILTQVAKQHGVPVFFVNLVGGNDDLVFDGSSTVINAQGKEVLRMPAFQEGLEVVDLNLLKPRKLPTPSRAPAQVLDALVLGLRDYAKKCGFSRAVLGLSGGIDSALTAWVAAEALGAKNILGVSMPSPYSSKGSIRDAQSLAHQLKIEFKIIPIDTLFAEFQESLALKAGAKVSLTQQNLQARIRGNLLMAISNHEGRILLSTGNKSELSLGYSTLYGDMAGGFAALSDVPKTLVYQVAREANRRRRAIPQASLNKPPSAELAPNQTDQDDLPPYDVIDGILKHYLEERLSPRQIVKEGYSQKAVKEILSRLDQNEYKRRQSPPGIRITSKAFGYGWRMPISSRYRVKF